MSDAPATDELSRRDVVLKTLRDSSEPRTIVELAEQLGVHPNTVRFHLESLASAGRVERIVGVKAGRGRPPTVYLAKAGMDPGGPTNYRFLATLLTRQFTEESHHPAEEARALGRAWSEAVMGKGTSSAKRTRTSATGRGQAIKRVAAELADLGFAPEPADGRSAEIRLRHCPFFDLVPANSEVVCSLHLGLMQGAFDALNGPVTVDRLEPFVEPDLCVARLAPAGHSTRAQSRRVTPN